MPISPEALVPRIGDYLIEKGLLKTGQLQKALAFQKKCSDEGKPLLLGQALLELGLISRETLDQAVTAQILQLQNALNVANQSLKQRVEERTQELRQALERVSELNQLKSNFIANISHELRTPLTHIKGYLDILGDGGLGPLNENQFEALGVLKKAESRLEHLIEDLIQFSLAARGDISLNRAEIAIDKLIRIAVDRSLSKARQQELALKIDSKEGLPLVRVDEDKIGWVIIQLLDNAIKFTPKGGQVVVQASYNDSGLITIAVVDTGIGIPQERMAEIFEPFHQLDGSAKRRFSGTGLGLAMVRRIIEAHGSQIKVQSVVEKGSCFEFSLPPSTDVQNKTDATTKK
jgi:signal transduction histidine kinase